MGPRSTTNAPKPNTRFLRNIVREADSHNAALLAKEAEESKERLRILRLKERAKRRGEEVSTNGGSEGSRSRTAQRPDRELYRVGGRKLSSIVTPTVRERDTEERPRERKRRRSRSKTPDEKERSRSPDRERRRHRKRSRSGERRSGSRSRKHREHRSERHHREKERDVDRHRDREREKGKDKPSGRRNPPPDTKPRESRHRSPTRSKRHNDSDTDQDRNSRKKKKTGDSSHISPCASPDPLDVIIGPAPPPPLPRARGRGTTSGASAMDARFSEKYDPSMDVRPDPDNGDDWDNAIEAYRDRQKWKTQGAERLRSAGFDENFITAWENNDTKNTANIKWAKDGVREWDRGKVVEEETGEVSVRASWAKGGAERDK